MLHDKDIREPLFDFLDENHCKVICQSTAPETRGYTKIRILEEKTMGKSRADVVMVTEDALYGIEIKSDADTYARLARQVKDYDKYYDFNYVVVGTSHALHIREHVPDYWGVITVEMINEEFDFYIFRRPEPNPKVTWKRKLEILWRPELALLQDWNQMPRYKEKSKAFVKNKIIERLENGKIKEAALKQQVSELLLERDYTSIDKQLAEYRKQ